MLQLVIFVVLSLTVSANGLTSCFYNTSTPVQEKCPGNRASTKELFRDDRMYEDQIYQFLDVTLREKLKGIDGSGRLPVLDPLKIPDIGPLTLGEGTPGYDPLVLQLNNITIENLLGYEPYNGSYEFSGFRVPVAIDFPRITARGIYDMQGWLSGLLYLEGSGAFELSILNVSLYVDLDLGTINNILVLECIGIEYNVGGAECNLENLLGGGDVGDMLNKILAEAIPTLLNLVKNNLVGRVVCPLRDTANKALEAAGLTMGDLLCSIAGFGCKN